MIISIFDYGSGNIKSVSKAVESAANRLQKNVSVQVIHDPKKIKEADKLILPGQGSFKQCAQNLRGIPGVVDELNDIVLNKKKNIFGSCVGMQLFADFGEEDGGSKGLGWIQGEVKKIKITNLELKLPHMGWNEIVLKEINPLFQNLSEDKHLYFVHSYEFIPEDKSVISATTDYSSKIVCSVEKNNLFGTQFHPEKSDKVGLKIIDNFIKL